MAAGSAWMNRIERFAEAVERGARGLAERGARAIQRERQAFRGVRLQQVVDRAELERGDGVLGVRRREHDVRAVRRAAEHV